jgi:hypothetical protein
MEETCSTPATQTQYPLVVTNSTLGMLGHSILRNIQAHWGHLLMPSGKPALGCLTCKKNHTPDFLHEARVLKFCAPDIQAARRLAR